MTSKIFAPAFGPSRTVTLKSPGIWESIETTLLTDQQAALAIQQSRLVASVALIEALGGGWSTTALPAPELVRDANPVFP